MRALRWYHRHRVVGLHHVPDDGPCLIAANHSFVTYDIALLGAKIYQRNGRIARGLGDRAMFQGPGAKLSRAMGFVEGTPENALELIQRGELTMVAPGGMREALRPSHQRYQLKWDTRKGFVRLAMRTGCPIVLAACPDADRVYHVYENSLTKLIYQQVRLPVPIVRGWGPSLWPRPVALTHVLSEPQVPPSADADDEEAVDAWHAQIVARMDALMQEAREPRVH
jgi:1-acyl-sn-glycerol-3-phosphate acyltransferase